MRRVILVLALAAMLAPGVLVRDRAEAPERPASLRVTALGPTGRVVLGGTMTLAGAWQLASDHPEFGGFSALVARSDGRMAAFSDRGAFLLFAPPDAGDRRPPVLGTLANRHGTASKRERDCEAVTGDPSSGRLWAAYEQTNAIVRFDANLAEQGRVEPAAMRGWPQNRGPEAMVRLADGRFVVLAETQDGEGRHAGLLFAGDPVEGAPALPFRYRPPAGYRPTDLAQLPDGRVLILNRRLRFPFRFTAVLVLADPDGIARRRTWTGRTVARLGTGVPLDNYEGMAVTPEAEGRLAIWLVSDDNEAALVQRTLLLKLLWDPRRGPTGPPPR